MSLQNAREYSKLNSGEMRFRAPAACTTVCTNLGVACINLLVARHAYPAVVAMAVDLNPWQVAGLDTMHAGAVVADGVSASINCPAPTLVDFTSAPFVPIAAAANRVPFSYITTSTIQTSSRTNFDLTEFASVFRFAVTFKLFRYRCRGAATMRLTCSITKCCANVDLAI